MFWLVVLLLGPGVSHSIPDDGDGKDPVVSQRRTEKSVGIISLLLDVYYGNEFDECSIYVYDGRGCYIL